MMHKFYWIRYVISEKGMEIGFTQWDDKHYWERFPWAKPLILHWRWYEKNKTKKASLNILKRKQNVFFLGFVMGLICNFLSLAGQKSLWWERKTDMDEHWQLQRAITSKNDVNCPQVSKVKLKTTFFVFLVRLHNLSWWENEYMYLLCWFNPWCNTRRIDKFLVGRRSRCNIDKMLQQVLFLFARLKCRNLLFYVSSTAYWFIRGWWPETHTNAIANR